MSDRDRFITEKVLGECWHEPKSKEDFVFEEMGYHFDCNLCDEIYVLNNNFSTPEGFFKLWNFCKEQEWWENFLFSAIRIDKLPVHDAVVELINPDIFADAIARFHKWDGE